MTNLLFEPVFPRLEQMTLRVVTFRQFGDQLTRFVQIGRLDRTIRPHDSRRRHTRLSHGTLYIESNKKNYI